MVVFPEKIAALLPPRAVPGLQPRPRPLRYLVLRFAGFCVNGATRSSCRVEDVPYDNEKIRPRRAAGEDAARLLTRFHAVDKDVPAVRTGWEDKWKKRYHAGIHVLDSSSRGRWSDSAAERCSRPETAYERRGGSATNVIFPAG
jgi:beta-1,4-mannooligosaccharide/beta-1,4-mannosyl-N-acetylglucosamine phosphorylase